MAYMQGASRPMPPRMLIALMCRKLHQPPSVILDEDYNELLWLWNTLAEIERHEKQ